MSKKKFKDGLESLFGGPAIAEPSLPENSPLLERTENRNNKPKKELKVRSKRSKSGKNFTSDLDTLFETVVEDNMRESKSTTTGNRAAAAKKPPVVGLDALIQRTTDHDYDYTTTKKRVTFIFDKKKLDKLKRIAKYENAYLKDIIGQIISTHLDKYDEEGRAKS